MNTPELILACTITLCATAAFIALLYFATKP